MWGMNKALWIYFTESLRLILINAWMMCIITEIKDLTFGRFGILKKRERIFSKCYHPSMFYRWFSLVWSSNLSCSTELYIHLRSSCPPEEIQRHVKLSILPTILNARSKFASNFTFTYLNLLKHLLFWLEFIIRCPWCISVYKDTVTWYWSFRWIQRLYSFGLTVTVIYSVNK